MYRAWWIGRRRNKSLIDVYQELARQFPFGLADEEPLPEEISGEVVKGVTK
jgi:hypothetical protein